MNDRKCANVQWLLFTLLFVTFAYFHHQQPGWNVNSRLALTFALVDHGTVCIDRYINNPDLLTRDVAEYQGHFYSDKIIGTSLLGVPAYTLIKAYEAIADATLSIPAKRYWVTVLSVGLLGALSGIVLFRLLLLWQADNDPNRSFAGPLAVTTVVFLGTMLLSLGTLFMPYLPAQFFLVSAIYMFERWSLRGYGPPPLFRCGLLAGLAILCEYLYGIAVGLLLIYMLSQLPRKQLAWRYLVGMLVGLLPFLIYTISIFGRLAVPYQYHANPEFREGMATGFMGAHWPRANVLLLLTFHPFRGLFAHSPMLLIALIGLFLMLRENTARAMGLFITSALVCYLLFNSGYYMWWGGWSFSPRHLAPAVPLLALPLGYAWRWRAASLLLAIPAVALHLIVTATDPQVPEAANVGNLAQPDVLRQSYPSQFFLQVWPAFKSGRSDANWGTWLGLHPGLMSLFPLLAFWIIIALLAARLTRSTNSTNQNVDSAKEGRTL